MKYLQPIFESNDTDGIPYAVTRALNLAIRLSHASKYSDDRPSPIFSFFTCDGGSPRIGLSSKFLENNLSIFKDASTSGLKYLKTGQSPTQLISLLSNLSFNDVNKFKRASNEDLKIDTDISKGLTPELKDNPYIIEKINAICDVLKSWNNTKLLTRMNIAVAVNKVTNYSDYMGSDFTQVYQMVIRNIKKMDKITPTSKLSVNVNDTDYDSDSIRNDSGEFYQIDSKSWKSAVTINIDGKDFIVGTFSNSSAYGHY